MSNICYFILGEHTNANNDSYQNKHYQPVKQTNRQQSASNKQQPQYQQHLACYTENERREWILALQSASHRSMKNTLENLRSQLRVKVL